MDESHYNLRLIFIKLFLSGRKDLNLRPLAPHASALAGLRHAPNSAKLYPESDDLTMRLCSRNLQQIYVLFLGNED